MSSTKIITFQLTDGDRHPLTSKYYDIFPHKTSHDWENIIVGYFVRLETLKLHGVRDFHCPESEVPWERGCFCCPVICSGSYEPEDSSSSQRLFTSEDARLDGSESIIALVIAGTCTAGGCILGLYSLRS